MYWPANRFCGAVRQSISPFHAEVADPLPWGPSYSGSMLDDGVYDAMVVDAQEAPGGGLHLEVTILAGAHKGEVLRLTAAGMSDDPLDLLAMPATLTVQGGEPHLRLDD